VLGAPESSLPVPESPVFERHPHLPSAPAVGAGIGGVAQPVLEERVRRALPRHPRPLAAALVDRPLDPVGATPQERLAAAAELAELPEDQREGRLHPLVGILPHWSSASRLSPTGRSRFSAPPRAFSSLPCSRRSVSTLRSTLPHRGLDPPDELVVHEFEVVELVRVADQGPADLADLAQVAPVLVGPREPRHLSAQPEAHLPPRHRGDHPLEALPARGPAGCAAAQVAVDDLHGVPAECAGPVGPGVRRR